MDISRYLDQLGKADVRLAIVGKAPFPSNSVDIPFCKPNWQEQLAGNCSGRHVLLSLGLDPSVLRASFKIPALLFEALLACGVVFLNASYAYLDGSLRKRDHLVHLERANKLNGRVLQSAEAIIYCGEASKIRWVTSIDRPGSHCVVHPDVRNRANPRTSANWHKWWLPNAIVENIGLTLPSKSWPWRPDKSDK